MTCKTEGDITFTGNADELNLEADNSISVIGNSNNCIAHNKRGILSIIGKVKHHKCKSDTGRVSII